MQPILLASDGSPSATLATEEALRLAEATEATLVVVTVIELDYPWYGLGGGYGSYVSPEIVEGFADSRREAVDGLFASVRDAAAARGVSCETVALDGATIGDVGEEICKLADDRGAQLIVIGSHGFGPVKRFLFGSVSQAVLHGAPCPVVVCRAETVEGSDEGDAAQ